MTPFRLAISRFWNQIGCCGMIRLLIQRPQSLSSLTKHTVATYLHTYGWPMYTYPFVYGEAPHLGNLISPIHLTQPRTCATIQLSNGVSHLVIAVYACIIIESYDHIYIYT